MRYSKSDQKWVRVSRRERCAVCGGPDYCTRSSDGTLAHCMRAESRKPAKGALGGWIHVLAEPLPEIKPRERKQEPKPNINWTAEAKRMFLAKGADEARVELAVRLGVSLAALESLVVGIGWDKFRGMPFTSWPERGAKGKCVGIVRRYADGAKKTIQHSSHGIYYAGRDPISMPGPIFIVEGGSDVAAGLTIGVNVIGRPSNIGGVELIAALLRSCDRFIIVIAENDEKPEKRGDAKVPSCTKYCKCCMHCWPGLAGANAFAARLKQKLRRQVWVRLLPGAKDTRDWLGKHWQATPLDFFQAVNGGPVRLTKRAESKQSRHGGCARVRRGA